MVNFKLPCMPPCDLTNFKKQGKRSRLLAKPVEKIVLVQPFLQVL